jgi:hypothetical protein
MNAPAAFRASYSDWKLIRTRKVVQIVLEVPVEEADAAYQVLGGMPNPAESFWCAVARLDERTKTGAARLDKKAKAKREWQDLEPSAQISIRCGELAFHVFLREKFPRMWDMLDNPDDDRTPEEMAIMFVRQHCGVASRADVNLSNPPALEAWNRLEWDYHAWRHAPAAGAA